jgi:hypothetical protein
MLESKDHQKIYVSSGVRDLTFASELAAKWGANVKSAPLGFCILVDGAPYTYCHLVGPLPSGVMITTRPKSPLHMVHVFATQADGLAGKLRAHRAAVAPDGMIWVSWPKKSSGVPTELTDVVVRDTALPLGLVDIRVCATDDIWSGLKFVIPKEQRKGR